MSVKVLYETGLHAAAPSEKFMRMGGVRTERLAEPKAMLYIHGSGDTALSATTDAYQRFLITSLSVENGRATIVAGDWGFQTWGNDIAMSRLDDGYAYLQTLGANQKIGLVAGSMGSCNALNWAYRNPDKVAFVAAMIPLTDLADIMIRGAASEVNAAYGGTYDDAVHGPQHSPVQFAADMDPNTPITLFVASNDPLAVPETAEAFVAARPQTNLEDLGAVGHTPYAIYTCTPMISAMVKEYL